MSRLSRLIRWGALGLGLSLAGQFVFAGGLPGRWAPFAPASVYLSRITGQPASAAAASAAQAVSSGPHGGTVAAASFDGDVRRLPRASQAAPLARPELVIQREPAPGQAAFADQAAQAPRGFGPSMPSPSQNFAGLSFGAGGDRHPPDASGDAGLNYYIQTVNTSIGFFSKAGIYLYEITFNDLFAGTGTACDSLNVGSPVTLYDTAADRFIVADAAMANIDDGPYYECVAVSKTSDPLTDGWWLYAIPMNGGWLNDATKLGVWPDAIYMSANMYDCSSNCSTNTYQAARVWALKSVEMYAGSGFHYKYFDLATSFKDLLPSNVRGAQPPAGTPNYFVSDDLSTFAINVFKFHVDWGNNSTLTGPINVAQTPYSAPPALIPELGGNALDSGGSRLMMQNQYRKLGSAESLWLAQTVGQSAPNTAGIRWYQVNVTGGTVVTTPVQQGTYRPDSTHRWLPSLAVDQAGNLAVGYSVASDSLYPGIRYAGRLSTDPLGALGQAETTLIAGTGAQTNNCPTLPCTLWGRYSSMTVDPVDDCTFWYTSEYYAASGGNWKTRIGTFKFPTCGQPAGGTATATRTSTATRTPVAGTPGPDDLFLPLIVRAFGGTFEIEPNNSLALANGPIGSGLDYHGYPNDPSDYFKFFAAAGSLSVDLTHNSASGTQLQFYYQSTANPVGYAGGPPYHINYNGAPGWYYVRVVTGGDFNSSNPYTLRVTYP